MAEEVTLRLTVDAVNGAKSVKEIRDLIRDATGEALKFKEGSAEFARFADIAAKAKDRLGDVRQQMAALDPDAKARSFMQLGNAIVGGFTAAQGAAALFGASTEDVQKALLKVQGAMALLHGFQAIQEGVQAFTALRGAIMLAVAGMNAMKLAIIGTGIGALVVAVGFLVAKLVEAGEAFKSTTVEITDHEIEVAKLTIEYQRLTGQITDLEAELKIMGLTHDKILNQIQIDAEKKLEAAGTLWSRLGDFVKDAAFRVELGSNTLRNMARIKEEADKQSIKELEKYNLEVSNKFLESEKKKEEAQKKADDDRLARQKELNRKLREENNEAFQKQMQDDIDNQRMADEAIKMVTDENKGNELKDFVEGEALAAEWDAITLQRIVKAAEAENEAERKANLKGLKEQKDINDAELREFIRKQNIRIQIESSIFSAISSIASATIKNQDKAAKFEKRLAAVRIIVSQAEALALAVKSGAGQVFPANLVAIATGVAAVIGIFAGIASLFGKAGDVSVPGFEKPSVPSVGGDVGGASIPSGVNFLEQPSTTLNGEGDKQTPPPPQQPFIIKNFISEYDITKTQDSVKKGEMQATIG